MLIILRSRLLVMALVPVLFSVVACDKLTAVVGNLKKSQQTQSEKSEVNASFRSEQISNLSQADFAGFIARKDALVIVDFYADWCGPCKMLGPILEKPQRRIPGSFFWER